MLLNWNISIFSSATVDNNAARVSGPAHWWPNRDLFITFGSNFVYKSIDLCTDFIFIAFSHVLSALLHSTLFTVGILNHIYTFGWNYACIAHAIDNNVCLLSIITVKSVDSGDHSCSYFILSIQFMLINNSIPSEIFTFFPYNYSYCVDVHIYYQENIRRVELLHRIKNERKSHFYCVSLSRLLVLSHFIARSSEHIYWFWILRILINAHSSFMWKRLEYARKCRKSNCAHRK